MAGEWIKVEKSTPEKPEVLRIARELAIDRDAVFGKLMLVWMWFDVNSVDGVVDGAVDADVDQLVRLNGFASVLRSVKWLEDAPKGVGLSLPNFDRHNGETAKKRALSNRRQSKWRNAHVDAPRVTNASTREEKRREDKKVIAKAVDNSPVVETLPLVKGGEFPVRASLVQELEPLYPAVDIPTTLREMKGWLVLNTERRKTRQGIRRFIGNWLQTEQAKHGS